MSEQGKLVRGKKWSGVLALAEYELTLDAKTAKVAEQTLQWLKGQKSILEDIKTYQDSLETRKETKSKDKKTSA